MYVCMCVYVHIYIYMCIVYKEQGLHVFVIVGDGTISVGECEPQC